MRVINIKALSEETGLTELAIRKMVRARELPFIQLGNPSNRKGKYLFNLDMVNTALEEKMKGNYKHIEK